MLNREDAGSDGFGPRWRGQNGVGMAEGGGHSVRVVLLPLGSIEAHGPHLPLDTDTRIAVRLAGRCAEELLRGGVDAVVVPPFTSTACSYAAGFPGTVSVDRDAETRALVDAARRHLADGADRVALVNLHFDPEHMRAVRDALAALQERHPGGAVFPDFTRRDNARQIGGEFATGACHGGEFETSLMLVAAPGLVGGSYRTLPPLEVNLARAIRDGKRSFRELGLDQAYCGRPASATREEGERLLEVLTRIVVHASRAPIG